MPDQLNKQAIVNLLIDSPLREPIKINLIDIVNNTTEPDLPKVFPTVVKELEIFQKATERRMKLAEETIAKLGGISSSVPTPPPSSSPEPQSSQMTAPTPAPGLSVPPLDLPPMPTMPTPPVSPMPSTDLPPMPPTPPSTPTPETPAAPSMPAMDASTPLPTPAPLGASTASSQGDEAALAEIQKELDSLKTASADDIAAAATPAPAPQA